MHAILFVCYGPQFENFLPNHPSLNPFLSYSSKRLLAQLPCFDTHTKAPGIGVPPSRSCILTGSSLGTFALTVSFVFNHFRTLRTNRVVIFPPSPSVFIPLRTLGKTIGDGRPRRI